MKEKNTAKRVGDLVTYHRKVAGRSARDVAREAGIDIATMLHLERGTYATPSPITLKGVAAALGIPILELFHAAGYVTPHDIVEMAKAHATRDDLTPNETQLLHNEYVASLIEQYGLDGPASDIDDDTTIH
jgi:transcriptional regulator with XRE-family HTH domain